MPGGISTVGVSHFQLKIKVKKIEYWEKKSEENNQKEKKI
jgi:hypothetical protein